MSDRDPYVVVPREVVEDAIALLTSTTADYREAFNAGAVDRVVAALRFAWINEKPTPGGVGFPAEPAKEPRPES